MYRDGDLTPIRQPLTDCIQLERCWKEVMDKANVKHRLNEVEEFNRFIITINWQLINSSVVSIQCKLTVRESCPWRTLHADVDSALS